MFQRSILRNTRITTWYGRFELEVISTDQKNAQRAGSLEICDFLFPIDEHFRLRYQGRVSVRYSYSDEGDFRENETDMCAFKNDFTG